MAVVVVGVTHTQVALKVKERAIHDAVVAASRTSAALLLRGAQNKAPGRIKGEIFTSVTNPRRFSGANAITTSTVSMGMRGQVGIWYEGGTGVYKRPEFGGPARSWIESPRIDRKAQRFNGIFRKFTSHFGQKPRPILEETARELTKPIMEIYRISVHGAVEAGG